MDFDFSNVINRRGTNALKWEVAEGELPMWVADMDFQTASAVREAVLAKAAHGIFGYAAIPEEYYEAVTGWWRQRHGFDAKKDWVIFASGIVPAISSMIRRLTAVGENVLIQTPVYNAFHHCIHDNGRNVLTNDLVYDGSGYSMDFDDLEKKLADPQTTMMILCNPHNPVGRIWNREELTRVGELACKHHVLVVSDEIHCDIVRPGMRYIPFASISEANSQASVTCVSPTKSFNLAALQTSSIIVPDGVLRHKVRRVLGTDGLSGPNAFAAEAAIAAFTKGGPWLDKLCAYIQANKDYAQAFIQQEIPRLTVPASDATYLLWIDCNGLGEAAENFAKRLREDTGLFLLDGAVYGENGLGFLRMNLACPLETVKDGLERLKKGAAAI
jgi:cystathionine beta-lyase